MTTRTKWTDHENKALIDTTFRVLDTLGNEATVKLICDELYRTGAIQRSEKAICSQLYRLGNAQSGSVFAADAKSPNSVIRSNHLRKLIHNHPMGCLVGDQRIELDKGAYVERKGPSCTKRKSFGNSRRSLTNKITLTLGKPRSEDVKVVEFIKTIGNDSAAVLHNAVTDGNPIDSSTLEKYVSSNAKTRIKKLPTTIVKTMKKVMNTVKLWEKTTTRTVK